MGFVAGNDLCRFAHLDHRRRASYLSRIQWVESNPNITREAETETFDQRIDDMSLEEVYETWKEVRKHGLGERGQDFYVNIRSLRAGRQRLLVIGIVLCVGGLFAAIGATLGRRKSPA